MIILLHGEDTFRSRQKMKAMRDRFSSERDPQNMNVVRLDAVDEEPGKIKEQILATPFLADKRMVIMENLLQSEHKKLQTELLERVESKDLPEDNVYIFWEVGDKPRYKKGKELKERLMQEKYSQEFKKMEGTKLSGWIATEVEDRGGKIDRKTVNFLQHHVGNDMWKLNNVIDQLVNYKNAGKIDIDDIKLFIEENVEDDIFSLVDAIVEKNSKEVYNMIQEQYRIGKDSGYIFGMVLRQFRILLEIRDAIDRGLNPKGKSFASKMDLHPYVLKKSRPLANKYSKPVLEKIYDELLDIDLKTKTGQHDQSLLIDVFVGKLCSV